MTFNDSCEREIAYYVAQYPHGTAFAMSDFAACGSYDAIRQAVSRLSRKAFLTRVVTGIYCMTKGRGPEDTPMPSSDEIANALARNSNWKILPGTELARYKLGLADTPPAYPTYLSSGPSGSYPYGNKQKLYMTHTSNRFLEAVPYDAALVISALMELNAHKITVSELCFLHQTLSKEVKQLLLQYLSFAPPRLRPIIELINDQFGKAGR